MMTGVTIRLFLQEVIVEHLEAEVTNQRKPYANNSSQGAHLCEAAVKPLFRVTNMIPSTF